MPRENTDDDSDISSVDTAIVHLEAMTVTEIKHKFSTYLLQAKEARLEARRSSLKAENLFLKPP